MIIDAFLYHDEREVLEIRLAELRTVVDRFVIVQGDLTHRGRQREFTPIHATGCNITNYLAVLPAKTDDPWVREHAQRAAMKDAVASIKPNKTDIVMFSDCDEIPAAMAFPELRLFASADQVVGFRQMHAYFRLNLIDPEPWYGTRATSWRRLLDPGLTPVNIRNVCEPGGHHIIEHGGWHFGWCGGNERVKSKLSSFAHQEVDSEAMRSDDFINACVGVKRTAHNQHQLLQVGLELMPKVVQENPERYRSMLA